MTPVNPQPSPRTSPPRRTDTCDRSAPRFPRASASGVLRAVYGDPRAAAELVPLLTDRQSAGPGPAADRTRRTRPRAAARATARRSGRCPTTPGSFCSSRRPTSTRSPPTPSSRAVTAAHLDTRPLEAAEAAGIAHAAAGGVVFRDAWTRIAAYETGSPADRRDVHRLLARVLRGDGETPRRSWHRGAGALGPSGRLAAELRHRRRSGPRGGPTHPGPRPRRTRRRPQPRPPRTVPPARPRRRLRLAVRRRRPRPPTGRRRRTRTPSPACSPYGRATRRRRSTRCWGRPCDARWTGRARTGTTNAPAPARRARCVQPRPRTPPPPPTSSPAPPKPPSTPATCGAAGRPPAPPSNWGSRRPEPSAGSPPPSRGGTRTRVTC